MIKVAIIGGKIHSGGKKNLIMEYYRHLDRTRVQYDFICDSDSNAIPEDEIRSLGGGVYVIPPYQNIMANMMAMYRIFKANRYDVVHALNSTMNVFPMMVAKLAGVPVRINECLSAANANEAKTYIKYSLKPFSRLGCNYLMSCGAQCAAFQFGRGAVDSGDVKVFKTVINSRAHSFDPELREATREKFGWSDKIVYGFIGRYEMQKNPLFLVDVMGAISRKQPDACFVTIGYGSLEHDMLARVESLGFADRFHNLGRREDIKQFYNAFDGFLLPSLYEGLPVVGLETQACGLPVFFSTEVTEEVKATDLAHFIALDKDVDYWADYIIKVVESNMPNRRSYTEELIEQNFDSHAEAERLLDFYTAALAEQS